MAQAHLDTEMLADLLSGSLEADDLQRVVIPHLLVRCPVCHGRVQGIRRLQRSFDHWNESVVVRESAQAPHLLESLLAHPPEERLDHLAADESLHTWGLAQLLLRHSREVLFASPAKAQELAELAATLTEHLPAEPYHPEWLEDLKARAWAHLGNALRVLGELRGAEAALRRARKHLSHGATGRPAVHAEILDLLASLRREQRRLPEALDILDQILELYRQAGDLHRMGRTLLGKAKVLEEAGEIEKAIELLLRASTHLDAEQEPRLPAYARHNLLCTLVTAGRFAEARDLLPEVQVLFREVPEVDRLRLRWAEGRIALGLEETGPAEAILREVQDYFLEHGMALDAARVSLDLALLYAEAGRSEELGRLAGELTPLFHSRDLHREALLALMLFQRAVEQRTLTLELLREVIELVRQGQPEGRRGRGEAQLIP